MKHIRWLILGAFILYHLFTLTYSPLPWLDEVVFNSISHSFAQSADFFCTAAPFISDKQVVQYGPVYFSIAGTLENIFGFGMLQFRLVSFMTGLVYFAAIYFFIIKHVKLEKQKLLIFLLLLFDPMLSSAMHGGRMDMLAAALILFSLHFFFELINGKVSGKYLVYYALISGLIAAAAVLTTPRVGILLISIVLVFILRLFRKPTRTHFLEAFYWGISFALPLVAWLAYASTVPVHEMKSYNPFGGNMFYANEMYRYLIIVYPLIMLFVVAVGLGIYFNRQKYFSTLVWMSIFNVIAFYLLIFETGGYYIIVLPFFYFIILHSYQLLTATKWARIGKWLVMLLLIFNISVVTVKAANTVSTLKQRDRTAVTEFVKAHVPQGSRVIGNELFYYAVMESGSDFQLINWYRNMEQREQFHREIYDYDFIIVSENMIKGRGSMLDVYKAGSDIQLIATFESPAVRPPFTSPGSIASTESYSCSLFRRIKPSLPE